MGPFINIPNELRNYPNNLCIIYMWGIGRFYIVYYSQFVNYGPVKYRKRQLNGERNKLQVFVLFIQKNICTRTFFYRHV